MASGPDQGNELSMLDSDDGNVSMILLIIFGGIDCTITVFWSFSACIMHSHFHFILYKIQIANY